MALNIIMFFTARSCQKIPTLGKQCQLDLWPARQFQRVILLQPSLQRVDKTIEAFFVCSFSILTSNFLLSSSVNKQIKGNFVLLLILEETTRKESKDNQWVIKSHWLINISRIVGERFPKRHFFKFLTHLHFFDLEII